MYKGVLFDLDGTLLEPSIDFKALREKMSIPQGESILDWVLSQPPGLREKMNQTLVEVELEAAWRARLMPGAEETLGWLFGAGVRVGILTRNCRKAWEVSRDRCGLTQLVDVFTRESGPAKPNPKCLAPLIERWVGISPRQIIHIGDYLYDLQLAAETGMYSILLHSTGKNPYPVACDHVSVNHECLLIHLKQIVLTDGDHQV